jgi:hypothetical protein
MTRMRLCIPWHLRMFFFLFFFFGGSCVRGEMQRDGGTLRTQLVDPGGERGLLQVYTSSQRRNWPTEQHQP